jgi:tetratricopeptide (TPR) repeat protein
MAFGFGFNKQKVLSAAEKFVQQGKLQNAITEYEKILKADPKDLTVMNTVGDLYARLGNNDKAVDCFKSVGDAYASQGFTVKAIAMYKKLSKMKSSLEGVLRLAELYTQQGLFNDARAQYLQVAEEFLRDGQLEQAVRIFQKTLEMDPENVAMRTRLAEVYVRLGKKDEAWQIFSAAAETLRAKGQLPAAEEILQRMLKLDPGNSYALLLRGRALFDSGDMPTAVQCLEKVADLDSHPDGLRTLMEADIQLGRLTQAGTLAEKLLSVHNDVDAMFIYVEGLIAGGQFDDALRAYQQHADRLLAANSAKMLENLHALIGHVRESTASLEMLLEMLNKAGENTHLTEVYELLAHAYVQSGELEKARDYYLKLTQLEPENQLHARNYQQVIGNLGTSTGPRLITAEEGAVMADELEATAAFVDQRYDDDVALAVRAALTDAELFISYNMPEKALGPLLSVLPQAPQDLRLNQRLAALHTRAGRFTEAAVCCRTLEGIYHDAGHPDEATRYGDLAAKYEERTATQPAQVFTPPVEVAAAEPQIETPAGPPAVEVLPVESVTPELPVENETGVPEAPVIAAPKLFFHAPPSAVPPAKIEEEPEAEAAPQKEIDLSEEWEGTVTEEPVVEETAEVAAPPAAEEPAYATAEAVAETVEEVRFYLTNGMAEEALTAFAKLQAMNPDPATLAEIQGEVHKSLAKTPVEEAVEEVSVEPVEVPAIEESAPAADEEIAVPAAETGPLHAIVSDLESSLGDGFLPQTTAAKEVPVEALPPAHAVASAQATPAPHGSLNEFVSDLESSLGDNFMPAAPIIAAEAPVAVEAKPAWPKNAKPIEVPEPSEPAIPVAKAAAAAQAAPSPGIAPIFTYQPSSPRTLGGPVAPPAGGMPDSAAGVDLADMFGELKHELEEDATTVEEDPETHYNLGVAFREMGLLDEAIGELQKVCQAVERGHSFPQIMQTYTWLSQCFLDKGVPEAAIRWYQKALQLPNLDDETRTALNYELAASYEMAGDKPAALGHFTQVYGSNIDYRDVAERIKTLKS